MMCLTSQVTDLKNTSRILSEYKKLGNCVTINLLNKIVYYSCIYLVLYTM